MFSQSSVGRLRPVLGRMKRTRDETWFDADDDEHDNDNAANDDEDEDDDSVVPEPKMELLKSRLDFLDEDDETIASGDNFPGV